MSFPVFLREAAEADIGDGADWYEQQWTGLGGAFLDEVEAALGRISEHPRHYPIVHRHTRRALIHRFPFGVFYRLMEDHIVVIAVLHASRSPRRWRERD